ncbi:MAG: flagellar export protein FliJ, partial [Desulfamplus sp.]|nr:flagellar export protein FliJ [Desulfamplus sp.]
MKKFNFRLQPVLKYREHLENLAQQEYVKACMDVVKANEQIVQMEQEYRVIIDIVEQKTVKGISAQLFRQYCEYQDSLENDIDLKRKEHEQLQRIAAVKLQALTKKSVERKVIERLKDKKRSEYVDEFQMEEQK